ncbi:uncharacterized protein MYCGRDRAFT_48997 [Zymoseptoria tritici IPO323]|uniref:Aminoglycoside phosphotransferase domain-containing protein n=1 Tax=Zymoseptoria tritici (strain CBS 115943 / IPO323) TaxID=336722 RepID=F9XLD2_ZYMTI|nr:uncharacterized protein MYCGRDRAFT_48997 [Zymoseptoria tritici IPO323]EGP84159.1 hypothetical protein MYCGRDRAFT_48997 [Zymoseptoria tritici IPO323]
MPSSSNLKSGQLTNDELQRCLQHLKSIHPRCTVDPLPAQGGCSFTVSIQHHDGPSEKTIAQFRPFQFALSPNIMEQAMGVHGALVPRLLSCSTISAPSSDGRAIQLVEMSKLDGVSFSDLQPKRQLEDEEEEGRLRNMIEGMAAFFTRSWLAAVEEDGGKRACNGKIGRSIPQRLQHLSLHLPCPDLRRKATSVLTAVQAGGLNILPIVLTHGDLLPSNILVNPDDWRVSGIVDWAEGEWLPFGIGLWGVEHLLGYMSKNGEHGRIGKAEVVYFSRADLLREHFWQGLKRRIPRLEEEVMARAVRLARDVGILLWHGFAWDDGRLDRVINAADDREELAFLEAMLDVAENESRCKL